MELIAKYGKEDLAILYIAKNQGKIIEFVESLEPPIPREEKWVLVISTMYGCPIGCMMCDAGGFYHGKISKEDMLKEIDLMIKSRFPDGKVPINKFKIQFARMGEPTLNEEVLDLLRELPSIYEAPGLMPCISTIAPNGGENFLNELIEVRNKFYPDGNFQLQFSVHSTNEETRKKWISSNIWTIKQIGRYSEKWYRKGDRKITLNFAVAKDSEIDPDVILKYCDPKKHWIKLTPINPTLNAVNNELRSGITVENSDTLSLVQEFKDRGFEASISIGEWEENEIGTNCGQFATKLQNGEIRIKDKYTTQDYILEK